MKYDEALDLVTEAEVIMAGKKIRPYPKSLLDKQKPSVRKGLAEEVKDFYTLQFLKNFADRARRCLSIWTPLQWERARRKDLRKNEHPFVCYPERTYEQSSDVIGNTSWWILFTIPRDALKAIIDEIDFLIANYEKQAPPDSFYKTVKGA